MNDLKDSKLNPEKQLATRFITLQCDEVFTDLWKCIFLHLSWKSFLIWAATFPSPEVCAKPPYEICQASSQMGHKIPTFHRKLIFTFLPKSGLSLPELSWKTKGYEMGDHFIWEINSGSLWRVVPFSFGVLVSLQTKSYEMGENFILEISSGSLWLVAPFSFGGLVSLLELSLQTKSYEMGVETIFWEISSGSLWLVVPFSFGVLVPGKETPRKHNVQ